MAKSSATEAFTLTADVVLSLGKYQQSDDLRKLQAKLTSTAREIRSLTAGNTLLGRIGQTLSAEQQQLLRDAAKVIESVGFNIEHAKEKRQRTEAALKAQRKEREAVAKKLTIAAFPLPTENLQQQLEVVRLALMLSRAGCYRPFYSATEISLRFRDAAGARPKLIGYNSSKEYWDGHIHSFAREVREEIELYLAVDDDQSVQQRLENLQSKLQKIRPAICIDPYEMETLRIWARLLATPQQGETAQ
jgi:hypothetical protein